MALGHRAIIPRTVIGVDSRDRENIPQWTALPAVHRLSILLAVGGGLILGCVDELPNHHPGCY
jgi:hypothetical protein